MTHETASNYRESTNHVQAMFSLGLDVTVKCSRITIIYGLDEAIPMNIRYCIYRSTVILYRWLILLLLLYILKLGYDSKITKAKLNDSVKRRTTTYDWFIRMRHMFMDMGEEDSPLYQKETPFCKLSTAGLGPINLDKTMVKIHWLKEQLPFVKSGGYYAPLSCRSQHKVAILVTYRDERAILPIFLRHMHSFLKRQLLEYRIFVIQQEGTSNFNEGALFNIGFLESQRFGNWHCYIFHDLHLLPLDDRILYSCPRRPTQMSTSIESGFHLGSLQEFGGVIAITAMYFEAVNGFSNLYPSSGAHHDIVIRLQSNQFSFVHYNASIARYATLPYEFSFRNLWRYLFSRLPRKTEISNGLREVKYNLLNGKKRRLYTFILVDVSPME